MPEGFAGQHNVELFSMLLSDCVKHYDVFPPSWMHYEQLGLLFVPLPFMLVYYSMVTPRGSAADHTRMLKTALTEFIHGLYDVHHKCQGLGVSDRRNLESLALSCVLWAYFPAFVQIA